MGTFSNLLRIYGISGIYAFIKIKIGLTNKIKLNGIRHPISLRPNSSDITTFKYIFAHGDYDFDIKPVPEVIIDAGANIGLASIFFANKYTASKIIAIELSTTNFHLLLKNTANYNNIKAINAGLWHKKETLKFQEEGFSPWGYKVNNKLEGDSISIDSITLLEIIDKYNINIIDLLKVDIEGAEVEVFSENYEIWLSKVRYLAIEYHDRWRADSSSTVNLALGKFNFRELGMVGENAVYINDSL